LVVVVRVVSGWVIGRGFMAALAAVSLAAVSFAAVSLAVVSPVAAQQPSRSAPAGLNIPPLRLPALPGLSAQQKQQLEQLHQKTQLMLSPLHATLWLREQELNVMWSQGTDRDKVLEKLGQMDIVRGRMREILVDQRLSLLAVLTPEQRAAFLALVVKAPPRAAQKNPLMGLEECLTSGDCPGATPPGSASSGQR
jgi:Spy/CpxP family protein refolding chaperone